MWYWNSELQTEAVKGLHDLKNCVEIADDNHPFKAEPLATGYVWISDAKGYPQLAKVEEPLFNHEQLVNAADLEKSRLITVASDAIAPLKDAVDLGIATDKEVYFYDEWRKYRVLVSRVDTNLAPDIIWPSQPKSNN